ncbi:MAG: hypothetical protein OXQ94_03480 [Gemmatimonadota bacterium]|nr:hypothetical protein [Gemmatimonadota bacterium]MDE2870741.1 hypothetical protein [Gemmatimonadota bacterium]
MKKMILSAFLVTVACALPAEVRGQIDDPPECESPIYWWEFVNCYMVEIESYNRVCDLYKSDDRIFQRYIAQCRTDMSPPEEEHHCYGTSLLGGIALPMCILGYLDQGWSCTARRIHLDNVVGFGARCLPPPEEDNEEEEEESVAADRNIFAQLEGRFKVNSNGFAIVP